MLVNCISRPIPNILEFCNPAHSIKGFNMSKKVREKFFQNHEEFEEWKYSYNDSKRGNDIFATCNTCGKKVKVKMENKSKNKCKCGTRIMIDDLE